MAEKAKWSHEEGTYWVYLWRGPDGTDYRWTMCRECRAEGWDGCVLHKHHCNWDRRRRMGADRRFTLSAVRGTRCRDEWMAGARRRGETTCPEDAAPLADGDEAGLTT